MLNANELWKELSPIVGSMGMMLFDIDMPSPRAGVLRIYIAQADGSGSGVTVDMCEAVSRKITSDRKFSWITDQFAFEVSSPGINRRLHRPEHFEHAVGERVKLTVSEFGRSDQTITGKIVKCCDGVLDLVVEGSTDVRSIALDDVRKAHVDFIFG
ncbi:MAG: ribosome maturation factor RimP [Bdellovibrionota bacterium]|jgi:ribosome maturation factor RimP